MKIRSMKQYERKIFCEGCGRYIPEESWRLHQKICTGVKVK